MQKYAQICAILKKYITCKKYAQNIQRNVQRIFPTFLGSYKKENEEGLSLVTKFTLTYSNKYINNSWPKVGGGKPWCNLFKDKDCPIPPKMLLEEEEGKKILYIQVVTTYNPLITTKPTSPVHNL